MAFSIFGGYDVRAVYPSQIDGGKARRVGAAFGKFLEEKSVGTCMVSRDNRASSELLQSAFIEGLAKHATVDAVNIGLAPSSTLCFALLQNPSYAGASITASHNPVKYNGIKFYSPGAVPLFAGELAKVKESYEEISENIGKKNKINKNSFAAGKPVGKTKGKNFNAEHAEYCARHHKVSRKLKVVVDCGNSVCALVGPQMLEKMGCDVAPLFCELDGSFPNHLPDPHRRENYSALREKVAEERADFGVMFDGDGDRAGFVDEKGGIIDCDFVHTIFLRDLLAKKKGAVAILDLRLSRAVFEEVDRLGGRAVMSKAGRMAIHEQMEKTRADYGGEVTGHISFRENGCNDDAFWSAALMAQAISNSGMPLSKTVAQLPHYFSLPEMRLPCPDENKSSVVEKIRKSLFEKYPKNIVAIDGVRLDLPNAWGLVRVSNTEPQITLRFEGKTKEELKKIFRIFAGELGEHKISMTWKGK